MLSYLQDLSGNAVLLRGAILPTSEPDEMRALSGSQVALKITRAVFLPRSRVLNAKRAEEKFFFDSKMLLQLRAVDLIQFYIEGAN